MWTFNDDGKTILFSISKYKRQLRQYQERCSEAAQKRVTKDSIYHKIAAETHRDYETVRKWSNDKKGGNGVGDLNTIKKLAEIMGIDYRELITEVADMKEHDNEFDFGPVSRTEKDLVKQAFELFIDFIYLFIGKDCKALYKYDEPYKEMEEYIFNLYRFLDRIALNIANDTYIKLRSTITELTIIERCSRGNLFIPKEWAEINNYLESSEFSELVDLSDDETGLLHFIDCNMIDDETAEKYYHMFLEDVPELISVADNLEDSDQEQLRIAKLSEAGYISLPNPNELVVREFANTLIGLMKKRFSSLLS